MCRLGNTLTRVAVHMYGRCAQRVAGNINPAKMATSRKEKTTMTRNEILAILAANNIECNKKAKKADLETLLPKTENTATNPENNIKKEENTMNSTVPTIASTEFVTAFMHMADYYHWTLTTSKKEDGVIAKEGRHRVLELYWSNTKEKLGGFDLYVRDDLFQDITELLEEFNITAQLTVNPKWKWLNRYSFDRQNAQAFMNAMESFSC